MSSVFKIVFCYSKNSFCPALKNGVFKNSSFSTKKYLCSHNPQNLEIFYQRILSMCKKKFKTGRSSLILSMSFFGPSVLFPKIDTKEQSTNAVFVSQESFRDMRKSSTFDKLLFKLYELISLAFRSIRLCVTFVPIFMLYPMTLFGAASQEMWWKLLLIGIEFSGPIFIKFGQWASTRRDLFPESFCNQFSRLQRRSRPHSWHYTKLQLKKAFGKNWRKIFVKFENNCEPIGSGCVAQVYKVWVNEDQIKNKDVLEEIISEQQYDPEEDKMDIIDDGLEVIGFHNWWASLKRKHNSDEMEAILEFKRIRDEKRKQEKENKNLASTAAENNASSDIKGVTNGLADEIMSSQADKPNEKKEEIVDNKDSLKENSHEHHQLAEQWQTAPESLEKFLPLSDEDLEEDLEGLVPVALKVLHPKMYRTFTRDMKLFKLWASCLTFIYPPLKWLNLEECLNEFYTVMAAQIDLRKEASNLDRFIESFSSVDTVRFPRPVRPFVTRRILVETFEEGEPMLNFITDNKSEPLKKNLAKIGIDTILKMIFTDNFVHGDLHPGNMLVQNETKTHGTNGEDPSHNGNISRVSLVDVGGDTFVLNVVDDPKPLRICILDCGIVATLKEKDLDSFKAVFEQVILGKGESVADLFLDRSDHMCANPDAFRRDMNTLVSGARKNAVSLEQVDVGLLLQEVLGLLLRHHIRLESAFSAVVLAIFVLEGLGRSLDPQMDILDRARPLLVP